MSAPWVIAAAVSAAAGAYWAQPVPVVLAGLLLAAGFVAPSRLLVVAGAGLLVSGLAYGAWAQLDAPVPDQVAGKAVMVRDTERSFGSVVAEVELNGRRYQTWASGSNAQPLLRLGVGEELYIEGATSELQGKAVPSLRRRHVAARLDVEHLQPMRNSGVIHSAANNLRAVLHKGSWSLPERLQPLYTGLVMGDDRAQHPEQQAAFRESGLAHLLAVSGQNVAFLLLILHPLLRRFDLAGRVVITVLALVLFGTVTRWEPSVMRAVAMALVVLTTMWLGRRLHPWPTLALAVLVCLVIDPFLVGSIGFLLSVSACAGMATLGMPIARRLWGPVWLRTAAGFTAAAQVGVAPVQLAVFGDLPAVALLTNIVGGPLAAGVMMWGMTAGVLAGLMGEPIATVLLWPAQWLLTALDWVARTGAAAPVGSWHVVPAVIAAAALLMLPKRDWPGQE